MEEALIKRILPHSLEAEQSVIGSMIMSKDAIVEASELITGADFYQQQYGIVFEAMVELHDEGKAVDLVTLQVRLREKELPPEISSMEFVRDLLATVPTSANVKYYAEIVAEKSMLRKLIKTTEEIGNLCYLGKEKTEICHLSVSVHRSHDDPDRHFQLLRHVQWHLYVADRLPHLL